MALASPFNVTLRHRVTPGNGEPPISVDRFAGMADPVQLAGLIERERLTTLVYSRNNRFCMATSGILTSNDSPSQHIATLHISHANKTLLSELQARNLAFDNSLVLFNADAVNALAHTANASLGSNLGPISDMARHLAPALLIQGSSATIASLRVKWPLLDRDEDRNTLAFHLNHWMNALLSEQSLDPSYGQLPLERACRDLAVSPPNQRQPGPSLR